MVVACRADEHLAALFDAHEARLAMTSAAVSSQGFNLWCVMVSFSVFDFFSISMDKVSLGLSPIVVQYRKNIRKKSI